jgi:YD repeat-containing protein
LIISPEGIHTHLKNNPVTLRYEQWQQAGEEVGPKTVIVRDVAGSLIEEHLFGTDTQLTRTLKREYDGLGQMIEERIEVHGAPPAVTQLRYDAYGRVIEKRLQDGTRLNWSFAPHSDATHPESISLTPMHEAQP